jgi:hypothetical protein
MSAAIASNSAARPIHKRRMSKHERKLSKRGIDKSDIVTNLESKEFIDADTDKDDTVVIDWMDAHLNVSQTMKSLIEYVRNPASRVHGKNIVFTVRHNDRSYVSILCEFDAKKTAFTYPKGTGSWYVSDFNNRNEGKPYNVYSIADLIPKMFDHFMKLDNDGLSQMYPSLVVPDANVEELDDLQFQLRDKHIKKLMKIPPTFIIEIYDLKRNPVTRQIMLDQSHFIIVEPDEV